MFERIKAFFKKPAKKTEPQAAERQQVPQQARRPVYTHSSPTRVSENRRSVSRDDSNDLSNPANTLSPIHTTGYISRDDSCDSHRSSHSSHDYGSNHHSSCGSSHSSHDYGSSSSSYDSGSSSSSSCD